MQKEFTFRFYSILNDFLNNDQKQQRFKETFKTPVTVRECIMAFRIPVFEIGKIFINENPASLKTELNENDRCSIYPHLRTIPSNNIAHDYNFILDAHLGKLARYLRMLGFDTLYHNNFQDEEIRKIAEEEQRIVLTRDKIIKSTPDPSYYYIRATEKHQQLKEVVKFWGLSSQIKPFTRCMTCNSKLIKIQKKEVLHKIDDDIADHFNEFYICKKCDKVFWKGSHFKRMEKQILDLISNNEN
ncbi:Mut7-C RNAse domain-containing protein [Mangrovivirga cuniculi]|uniref:Twitching motility protein PilT n=1 Tax=Mangrovivirga cuniculi TaxID=2715131 RepID=A0A4D7JT94_9BACT|nr:Mut7-C RNAse domain-containing protein [Mangrovivirga cuniculi]QCK16730.1 hypothetical protein DCC35_19315 [Mangrovivirga cuniculi]